MIAFLSAPENVIFVSALVLMLLLGVVQAVGLTGDMDLDGPEWLSWLGFGRVPAIILFVLLLACFGLIGLIGQQIAMDLFGGMLPMLPAVGGAAVLALPATAISARVIAPILPQDHTTAIDRDDLVGRSAVILTGRASAGSPARGKAEDWHGQIHYLMIEPDNDGQFFVEGERVLLVRREGDVFRAIGRGDHYLPQL